MNEPVYKRISLEKGDVDCYMVSLPVAPLIVINAPRGFLMCGYLDISAAERIKVAAARVVGVSSFNDALNAEVIDTTSKARELGVRVGMRGKDALERFC
ncbi:MAG: YunC family protein [Methermicoccaceae archaeon]